MVARWHHRVWHYLLLLAVGWCMFLVNLGGPSLWDVDEGRNAPCAYEMMASGDWVVPTHNGVLRSAKPVLLYWLQIAAYSCFGVNEFDARLPSALAALASLLLAYELGREVLLSRHTRLELAEARAQLAQVERVSVLGQLASGCSRRTRD